MMRFAVFALALAAAPTAAAAVIHVDAGAAGANDGSSWTDAYVALADALDAAAAGDQVWVAQGTYRPDQGSGQTPGDTSSFFVVKSGVELYGGFAGTEATLAARAGLFSQTVLSGDLAGDDLPNFQNRADNCRKIMLCFGADATTVIDGFRMRGGNGTQVPSAGGALRLGSSSPTVRFVEFVDNESTEGGGASVDNGFAVFDRCRFEGNRATESGGGLHTSGNLGFTSVLDCEFFANSADALIGGGLFAGGRVTVRDTSFRRNRAQLRAGGAFVSGGIENGHPNGLFDRLAGCEFIDNDVLDPNGLGGGLMTTGDPHVVACSFLGNAAWRGGGFHALSSFTFLTADPTLIGCRFSGNVASGDGGGVYGTWAGMTMRGCTFSGNVAFATGGGVFADGEVDVEVSNCILHGNQDAAGFGEASQLRVDAATAATVDHSCVQGWSGGLGGAGNHGLDPQFADPDGADNVVGTTDDDLTLAATSPCVDAGDNGATSDDWLDLDGDGVLNEATPLDAAGAERFTDVVATVDVGVGLSPPIVDMGAHEAPGVPRVCQADLGFQGPGDLRLSICGQDLTTPGNAAGFELRDAPPNAPLWIVVGTQTAPTPVGGGTLLPDVGSPHLVLALAAGPDGRLAFPVSATGVPATVFIQAIAQGGSGFEFSNAVKADF